MKENKGYVIYEDFGAKGDGVTNDFEAILAAHNYANEQHLPVRANPEATYYISDTELDGVGRTIVIKTDVDWCGAHFIIDDTVIAHEKGKRNWNTSIFTVLPYENKFELDAETVKAAGSLMKGDTVVKGVKLGYPALLIVYNENHRVYIRYGFESTGNPQHEVVLIDKDGNIDPTTPIMHDYDELTKIEVIRTDIPPLTLENGIFTQYASRVNTTKVMPDGTVKKTSSSFHRNLRVNRSNTRLYNIKNYNKGEISLEDQAKGITGTSYQGFYSATEAHNVLIEDCVVSARRYYTPGTYGFGASLVNQIVLKNCKQENYYLKDEDGNDTHINSMESSPLTNKPIRWGLGGTNYCKNMVYDGCEITRFDAHAGLCNGKIINSKCSYINLIGYGEMLIENSNLELKDPTMFQLRRDYGSTWEGTVIIRNCDVCPNEEIVPKDELFVCSAHHVNHYFGYTCHFPNLLIDNLRLPIREVPIHIVTYARVNEVIQSLETEPYAHRDTLLSGEENKNPYVPPKFIRVINNEGGHKFYLKKLPFFENTVIEGVMEE